MTKLHEIVTDLVGLAGGELTGRVRLQKIIYLMDQLGLKSGASYIYYYYGPYSEDLWDAVSDAKFFDGLREEMVSTNNVEITYSIFKLPYHKNASTKIGAMTTEQAKLHLEKLKSINSTILELASTIHWIAYVEKSADWKSELKTRKSGKVENGRFEKALDLLGELHLAPDNL